TDAGAAEPRVTFSTMSLTDPSPATDAEAYEQLMRAYVGLLQTSERYRHAARPLVAYYTQSHVGQRVTQLHTALVRTRARSGHISGWSTQDIDRRREELELLAPTLQRRITIGRLFAVVPLGIVVAGTIASHVKWVHAHAQPLSWLVVVAVIALTAVDAAAAWCFMKKWHLFRGCVRAQERSLYCRGLLSDEPEPRVAFHLWVLGFLAAAIGFAAGALSHWDVVDKSALGNAHGELASPATAACWAAVCALLFTLCVHGCAWLRWRCK
ncbi:MAG TPA: hypothetical protein VGL44_05735, partial [Gaiellales bacterium]